AFSLMAGVLIGATFTDVTLTAIIQKMFDGMDSEALLAIPFFLLVGELMSSANVVSRITNLSLALVGHIRGGLSQVVTVFSMFFSEMSGSTSADVAVISRALGGPMKKEGYTPAFAAADHHRRRQRLRMVARLSARRDRDRGMDHEHRGQRSSPHHAAHGAALHHHRRFHRAGSDDHHLHAAGQCAYRGGQHQSRAH